jgi:hypothetical protein
MSKLDLDQVLALLGVVVAAIVLSPTWTIVVLPLHRASYATFAGMGGLDIDF